MISIVGQHSVSERRMLAMSKSHMKAMLPRQTKAGSLEASLCLLGVFQAILEAAVHVRSCSSGVKTIKSRRANASTYDELAARVTADSCPFVLFLAHNDLSLLCEVL